MIWLSLGSNLGDRAENLRRAVELLRERALPDLCCSIAIETKALLPEGAPPSWDIPYLNAVAGGTTALSPADLLKTIKQVERDLGRPDAYERWSPRLIDLDILLWDDKTIDIPGLKVPHPQLPNRPFLSHLLGMMEPTLFPLSPYLRGEGRGEGQCGQHTENSAPSFTTPHPSPLPVSTGRGKLFDNTYPLFPRLVGVVNVTPDSFSDGGQNFTPDAAIKKALTLRAQGAAVVELGSQSTRPNATMLPAEEEYARLAPVLDGLRDKDIPLSIDTFRPEVISKVLPHPAVAWINDVTGTLDDATLRAIAASGKKIVMMHSLGIPPTKDNRLPDDEDPVALILDWAQKTAVRLQSLGFKKPDIILDPGIGFGKSAFQSLALIRRMGDIRKAGCAVMSGHSRKSYMTSFTIAEAADRDLETAAVSLSLADQGIEYLRVHDIETHRRMLVAQGAVHAV